MDGGAGGGGGGSDGGGNMRGSGGADGGLLRGPGRGGPPLGLAGLGGATLFNGGFDARAPGRSGGFADPRPSRVVGGPRRGRAAGSGIGADFDGSLGATRP